jgi:hypothetical protein
MFPGGALAITPSDTVNLASPSAVFVGGAGNVRVLTAFGDDTTFVMQSGAVMPVQVIRVYATSTTATSLIRIY